MKGLFVLCEVFDYFTSTDNDYPEQSTVLVLMNEFMLNQISIRVKPYVLRNGILMHDDKEVLQACRISILRACHDNPFHEVILDLIRLITKLLQNITEKVSSYTSALRGLRTLRNLLVLKNRNLLVLVVSGKEV